MCPKSPPFVVIDHIMTKGGEIMKKIALLLAIVLFVATPLTVQAATPRFTSIFPEISFTGTTANCTVRIFADNMSKEIEATIKLWHGTTCLETWYVTGIGYLSWRDTATIASSNTYRLSVDATIDGRVLDQVYIDEDCP